MPTLDDRLSTLEDDHRAALEWFRDHAGKVVPWPEPLPSGLLVVSKAKGIRVPAGWQHALSIRQSLGGPYADRAVQYAADGSWSYDYYQEGPDPATRDRFATNRALLQNMKDGVPVGVLIQTKAKPNPRYEVLGLAEVSSWSAGYFKLSVFGTSGAIAGTPVVEPLQPKGSGEEPLPLDLTDARRRIDAAIVARQGAGAFRNAALQAFNGQCAVTGCNVPAVLEAAHIVPYLGASTNVISNTLLLRADIHTLFDRGLLFVSPETLRVRLAPELKSTHYASLEGKAITLPAKADIKAWITTLKQREELLVF